MYIQSTVSKSIHRLDLAFVYCYFHCTARHLTHSTSLMPVYIQCNSAGSYIQLYICMSCTACILCYLNGTRIQVIRPWGMAIWDEFRNDLDKRIKANGVDNAYFPLFIPRSFLSKEVSIPCNVL
jgi:hypothetical protein